MVESKLWSLTEYEEVTSYLTGRTLYANTGTQFVVPPSFSTTALRRTLEEYEAYLVQKYHRGKRQLSRQLRESLNAFPLVETAEEFGEALERFLSWPANKDGCDNKARQTDFCARLWQNGCLIWPPVYRKELNFNVTRAWGFDEGIKRLIQDMAALQTPGRKGDMPRVRALIILMLARGGAQSVGDLTPEVAGPFFADQMPTKTLRLSTVSDLIKLQAIAHGDAVKHLVADYGRVGRFAVRSDDTFQWALDQDPTLTEWVAAGVDFMGGLKRNLTLYRTAINRFFDFLIADKDQTRQPAEYVSVQYQAAHQVPALPKKSLNGLYYFFDRILDTRCVDEDDHGNKVRLPGYKNPLRLAPNERRAPETHRNPMPTRFVRMLHDILVESDFAWPKAYGVSNWNRKGGDMYYWLNPATNATEEVWCPVRTIAILIKLLLPARTFQVRMLDSGEADPEVYRPEHGGWLPNTSSLVSKVGKRGRGVFYRHRDRTGKELVFIRFNTNKTGDIDMAPGDTGYIMPWEHQEALRWLAYLRDWQERYNSLRVPTNWADIKEQSVSTRYAKEVLEQRGANCFLFRDACSPYSDQPVTDSRLTIFWRNLNAELERRLVEAGETMPDGSPIKLVERLENDGVGPAVFDLHTLRVTIITAMAEAGVPIDIMMKVVGHATVVMTLYYTKLSPNHISERLNDAELRIYGEEQRNWQHWLTQQSREVLLKAAAYNAPDGIDALVDISPASWVIRDHGICPIGCSRCQDGGPPVVDTNAYQKYGAVPGGSSNCVRCRFFITGPAFLLGLQAYFDNTGYRLREASEKYQASKDRFETLEAEYNEARIQGMPIPKPQVQQMDVAAGNLDQQTLSVDEIAHSWHATYRLIEQCLAIVRDPSHLGEGSGNYALVAVGGIENVEAVLEETSDFELIDRVCQTAVFFDGLDSTLPNVKRLRAFDAMLKRNGHDPVFVELSEQDALTAGNQLAAFLYTRFGREKTNALLAGKETLRRLGIEQDVLHKLASVTPIRLQRPDKARTIDAAAARPALISPTGVVV